MKISNTFINILLTCVIGGASSFAFALDNPELIELQRQQEIESRRLLEQYRKPPDLSPGMPPKENTPPVSADKTGQCFTISTLKADGGEISKQKALEEILNGKYAGLCITKEVISSILSEATSYYIRRGFSTSKAILPPQDLASGVLQIKIVEGKIEKIEMESGEGNAPIDEARAFPRSADGVLNIRNIEHGLEQINRLRSNKASMKIKPGKQPSHSIVSIKNTRQRVPIHLRVSSDNRGSKATGENKINFLLTLENPNSLDILTLSHGRSLNGSKDKYSRSYGINSSIPLGWNLFSLSYNTSNSLNTATTASGSKFKLVNKSSTLDLTWNRTLHRNHKSRVSYRASMIRKDPESYVNEVKVEVSSRPITVLENFLTYNGVYEDGKVELSFGLSKGLSWLNAYSDPSFLAEGHPKAQFTKFNMGLNLTKQFKLPIGNFAWSTDIKLQHSSDNLYSSEQMYLGKGVTPGYTTSSYGGDNGYLINNKIDFINPLSSILSSPHTWTARHSYGKVWSNFFGEKEGDVASGYGFSMQYTIFKNASLDIDLGRIASGENITKEKNPFKAYIGLSFSI